MRLAGALVFLLALAPAPNASALLCQPILGCTCAVTAADIAFGAIDPLAGPTDASGQVSVDCTGVIDVAPSVTVSITRGLWGSMNPRQMRSAAGDLLIYNLYTSGQYNVVWGDGTGGSSTVAVSGGLLTLGHWNVSRSVYGRASPASSTRAGAYSDTLVVRIDW